VTRPEITGRPVVLDSEGLSRAVARDTYLAAVVKAARDDRCPVVVSAMTVVETVHPATDQAALRWTLSRLTVAPVTDDIAADATRLLISTGRHGHQPAVDAVVCATALRLPGRPIIYTSDPDDIRRLVDGRATVVPLH